MRIVWIAKLNFLYVVDLEDCGHCGYSVHPTERNKGYATEMLAPICQKAKAYGLKCLQMSMGKSNIPLIRAVLKNSGQYSRSYRVGEEIVKVYFIDL